jgi:sulfide:quinone oxidoreductase
MRGFGYLNSTQDIKAITADGIEFASGASVEAKIKIVLGDRVPHPFLTDVPISDEPADAQPDSSRGVRRR